LRKNRSRVTLLPMISPAFRIGQSTRAPFRGPFPRTGGREKNLVRLVPRNPLKSLDPDERIQGNPRQGGEVHPRTDKNEGRIAAKYRAVKWKYTREPCLPACQLTLAGLTLYRSLLPRGKQPKEPSKTNRSKGQARSPCNMPRSGPRGSGAIASTVSPRLPWRKRLSRAERPALSASAAHRAEASLLQLQRSKASPTRLTSGQLPSQL
jgi:hypothetical protein